MSDSATPWTAACQASLPITSSRSSLKLLSIESVIPSNHLILCPQSFPTSGSCPRSWFFTSGGQSTGVSASASILQMNIQDWFPLWKAKVKVLQLTEIMRADLRSDSLRFFLGKDTRKPMCSLLPYTPLSFCHVRTQQEGRIYIPGTYPSLEIKLANTLTLNF